MPEGTISASVRGIRVKISIIVATTGRRAITARAVRSMLQQEFAGEEYELVLVLDGCEEPDWLADERRAAEPSNARCRFITLAQPKGGQAASINAGLRAASGELALFLDDDILCPPDLLSQHVAAHSRHPGRLVFGPILTSQESAPGLATDWIRNIKDSWFLQLQPDSPTDCGWCFSFGNPNTSARRTLLLEAGTIDESFWRQNDTEFGFRLWKQGLRFSYLPDAAVAHVVDESLGDLVGRHAFEDGRGEARLCRKHPEYRRHALLAGLSQGNALRTARRRLLASAARWMDLVLAPLSHLANALRRLPLLRRAGLRLVSIRYIAHFYRGAIAECGSWKAFEREFGMRLPVLVYHRVGQAKQGEWYGLTISNDRLESHLRWLKRNGWTAITAAQWLAWLESGTPLPEKPVLLSFDDGYAENLANAFPPLQRHGFVAMNAIVTGLLGSASGWDSENNLPRYALMNAEDVRRWSDAGMEFASHSRSHRHLPALSDWELAGELAASSAELAEITGVKSDVLVYPFGEYDDRVCDQAAHDYKMAFSLDGGLNSLGQHPMRMRRIVISASDTPLDLWFYLNFGTHPLRAIRRRFRSWAEA
jgi:peptidoglycan/xylan/chitin deacetylase (PgdA/CDA1 family)/GT2 family glycosyltransferase